MSENEFVDSLYELLNPLGLCPDDDDRAAEAIILDGVAALIAEVERLQAKLAMLAGLSERVIVFEREGEG